MLWTSINLSSSQKKKKKPCEKLPFRGKINENECKYKEADLS